MADNFDTEAVGTTGDTFAADEITGVKFQRVKIVEGADGTNDGDISSANPLPVDASLGGTVTVDLSTNNDVQGAAAEGAAVSGNPFLIAGDDGTNVKHVAVDASGNVQADIVGALPSGTNAIGKLAANSGVDIGDVDVTSVAGANFSAAEAAALPGEFVVIAGDDGTDTKPVNVDATTGDVQVDVTNTVTVTDDGSFTLAANDGVDIGDVTVNNTVTVDLGANNDVTINGSSVVFTDDTSTHSTGSTQGLGIMATATPTDSAVDANDIGMVAMSTDRRLHVDADITAQSGSALDVSGATVTVTGDNAGSITVDTDGGALDVSGATVTVSATQLDVDDLAPTADGVSAALDTSQIMDGTTALTPKYAVINNATNGNNTIVSAVAAKKIRVLCAFMVARGDVNARFESDPGGTALTGQMDLTTNSGFTLPFSPVGWFETAASATLNLELNANINVDGSITYIEV